MEYRFDKEKFMKNAPSNIKKRLKHCIDDIENLKVDFSENSNYGTIEFSLCGTEYEVYPVYKEWCSTMEQLKLI